MGWVLLVLGALGLRLAIWLAPTFEEIQQEGMEVFGYLSALTVIISGVSLTVGVALLV